VWTADLDRAAAVAERLRTGYTLIDAHGAAHLDERAPFGGLEHSGMGPGDGRRGSPRWAGDRRPPALRETG
jgi:acyl-CoA reductase-like NAD-dependent aldehyde dehydrogenase